MKRLKIAIIGAGPAGNFTAYLLASLGHEVHLFEQKTELKRRVCGEYLSPMGVDIIKKHGLKNEILSNFKPLNGMILNDVKNNRVIKAHFPQFIHSSLGASVNRQVFDENILKLALKNNVQYHPNHRLLKLNKKQNGYQLFFDNGDNDSLTKGFDCDFLIAADGRNSHIARLLKHSPKVNSERVALHVYLPRKSEHGSRFGEMHIYKDGSYCGLNPISDEEVNFSIVCDSSEISNKANIIDFMNKKILESDRLSTMFDPIAKETKVKTSSPLSHKNSFIAGENLAYVGDASGFIDPLTGEGITNALLSADLLYNAMVEYDDLSRALTNYKIMKIKVHFQKKILNTIFQYVIRTPQLVTLISSFLQKNKKRADIFIGIIGNIFTPIEGAFRLIKN